MNTNRTLSTSRTLAFTPQAIYEAFAAPQLLAQWWGPQGFTNTFDRFDFREGGAWVFTMHGPNGQDYPNKSYFAALEPHACIVIRHDCVPFFTLTVRLTPVLDGTLLTWEQTFDDAATAQAVQTVVSTANEQNLDRLTQALAGHAR